MVGIYLDYLVLGGTLQLQESLLALEEDSQAATGGKVVQQLMAEWSREEEKSALFHEMTRMSPITTGIEIRGSDTLPNSPSYE